MNGAVRRVLITAAIVIVVMLLAGATYQGVATAFERRDFPPPGNRIDIGGHQLHLYCTGDGKPTVILEAPAMGVSAAWAWVQPAVARQTRVCSYDRSGLGWSEAGDRPYAPQNVPEELHALLRGARIPPPFVIVGESLGAAFARMYTARFSAEVSGLVLVDDITASAAEQAGDRVQVQRFVRLVNNSPWLARTGVLRATRMLSNEADGLPQPSAGAVRAFLNRPDHLTRAGREIARWDETVRLASEARLPQSISIADVRTGRSGPGGLLTDGNAATRVTEAIAKMVISARR